MSVSAPSVTASLKRARDDYLKEAHRALKLDGRLTVQTKSDGPLDLITADYFGVEADRPRGVRGFARVDAARAPAG